MEDIFDFNDFLKGQNNIEVPKVENLNIEPIESNNLIVENHDEEVVEYQKIEESTKNYYKVYKDISENFSCDIDVEGANISETKARLILESKDWTIMFEGDIDRNGKCNIDIKKLNIFEEGTIGKIKLEVIADNSIFIPWQDEFQVKLSKKVQVKVNESNRSEKRQSNTPTIKVNINK